MSIAHVWSTTILQTIKTNTLLQRRKPSQERSRVRYEKILDAARQLIAQHGNDSVSMREIALAAEVPIASVYQYFPDKNGLLWALIADVFEMLQQTWDSESAAAESVEALNRAAIHLFDVLIDHCESDAAFSRLWVSVQANTVLAELDHGFNIGIADSYCKKMTQLEPGIHQDEIWHRTLLMSTLTSTALQLAFKMASSRKQILSEFRKLLVTQMTT